MTSYLWLGQPRKFDASDSEIAEISQKLAKSGADQGRSSGAIMADSLDKSGISPMPAGAITASGL
jgi:hypothetical protein